MYKRSVCAAVMLAGINSVIAQDEPNGSAINEHRIELTRIDPPAGDGARFIDVTPIDGGLMATWTEPVAGEDGPMRVQFARFDGSSWAQPSTITTSDRLFVNWADFPTVTDAGDGALVAHWLERSGESTYAYDVQLARSTDGGLTWGEMGAAHDDGTKTEHGFVSFIPATDGARAFWLDGRETGGGHGAGHVGGKGRMTLRTAVVGEQVGTSHLLDEGVCDCCATDAAMTSNGPIVVYRDRTFGEIRDIAIVRMTNRSRQPRPIWSKPRMIARDGWEIAACPVNGPAVAAQGDLVAVAWYTGARRTPRVQVAFSTDAGATFSDPIIVDELDDIGNPQGRVDIILDDNGDAIVSWLDVAPHDTGPGGAVRVRRVTTAGKPGPIWTAFETSTQRSSGFPHMIRVGGGGGEAALAWTVPAPISSEQLAIAVARFDLNQVE